MAELPPIDLEAELARIDARRASLNRRMDEMLRQVGEPQQVERDTWWSRWTPAVVAVGGMAAGAALFAAGMFVASQTPTGWHDGWALGLVALSLFAVVLLVLSVRR